MLKTDSILPGNNILFSPSYFYRKDIKQWRDQRPYPPYGTLVAAAWMKQNGFEATLFDSHLGTDPREILSVLDSEKPGYLVIWDDGFNYLTKMCLTIMRSAAFDLIGFGKNAGCQVIVYTSDAMDQAGLYLSKGADFLIYGEGELSLLQLIQSLEAKDTDQSHIPGLIYKKNEQLIKTEPRPVIRELDLLPDPAWDLLDLEPYRQIWKSSMGFFSLNIATTRGCPYKCNWCAKPIYGNRYNSRSPHRVVSEMKYLVENYGVEHFWVADDIFGLNPHWVEEFRKEIKRQDLKIKYKIQSRADLLIRENYIDALVESGLAEVWIGAESGSQKILDAMDKGTTLQQIARSTEILQSKKIRVGYFLQFGYPGEGMTEIKETIHMMLRLMPDDLGISISYPLPGTVFYERVKADLGSKRNWSDSDDLELMYRGPYSAEFYRQLHRFVHKIFRLKQGWNSLKIFMEFRRKLNRRSFRSILSLLYYIPAAISDRIKLAVLVYK